MCFAEEFAEELENYGEVVVNIVEESRNGGKKVSRLRIVPKFREEDLRRSVKVLQANLELAINKRIS
jgi:hypothetical protein